jgi:nitroimidazol reductase NimA-like FMN-containing flavoprotein (pyridoxamine 5'-phosphate oxidase superfamily)
MADPTDLTTTARSTLRRKRERGSYDRQLVNALLDEALLCHVGFHHEGATYVVPMTFARSADTLYLHGASANHALKTLATGSEVCVSVTLLDGLVFSRSAFHHSMNYRSIMLFGPARQVEDEAEKREALLAIVDHMARGRASDTRPPSASELRATLVLGFAISEGSVKVRTGGPVEEPEDLTSSVWAGELPIELTTGTPITDQQVSTASALPSYIENYPPRRSPLHKGPGETSPSPGDGG